MPDWSKLFNRERSDPIGASLDQEQAFDGGKEMDKEGDPIESERTATDERPEEERN